MKLWDKGLAIDKKMEAFTVGKDRELDIQIAKYDILASGAHARMLEKVGLLTKVELKQIEEGLAALQKQLEEGTFTIGEEYEDVHSKIEGYLT